ncbi:MAG: hypothetical protein JXB07_06165 [Anaerolineae bacterium]|nr:hypothetical protein [Anaerolineae bacterium]
MNDTSKSEPPKRHHCGHQDIAGLMRTIFSAEDDDITCGECYDHIDEYVDMLRAGEDAATVLPKVKTHLAQCKCCEMEFKAFIAILEAEADRDRDTPVG